MKRKPLPRRILSFLHLGDSYTVGEGVPPAQSWPSQLKHLLEVKGWRVGDVTMLAETGWTSGDLLRAMATGSLQGGRDLVTLCIGVNNQYQGRELQEFRHDLVELLNQAGTLTCEDGEVVLLSIPDWSVSPFAADRDTAKICKEIERFNEICFHTAQSLDITYIEWTSLTRLFEDEYGAFADDGLHPSSSQYREWATFLLQHLVPGI